MKSRIIAFSCIFLLIASCKTNRLPRFDYDNGPNPWVNAFKDNVFITCLYQSYPAEVSDSVFRAISKYDLYNPYDGFMGYKMTQKKFLDSLSASVPKNMPAFWHADEQENKGKNVYLCTCLHYYKSRELDSIARSEYKKYEKWQKKAGF